MLKNKFAPRNTFVCRVVLTNKVIRPNAHYLNPIKYHKNKEMELIGKFKYPSIGGVVTRRFKGVMEHKLELICRQRKFTVRHRAFAFVIQWSEGAKLVFPENS